MYDTPVYQEMIREGKWDVPILEPTSRRVTYMRDKEVQDIVAKYGPNVVAILNQGLITKEEFLRKVP